MTEEGLHHWSDCEETLGAALEQVLEQTGETSFGNAEVDERSLNGSWLGSSAQLTLECRRDDQDCREWTVFAADVSHLTPSPAFLELRPRHISDRVLLRKKLLIPLELESESYRDLLGEGAPHDVMIDCLEDEAFVEGFTACPPQNLLFADGKIRIEVEGWPEDRLESENGRSLLDKLLRVVELFTERLRFHWERTNRDQGEGRVQGAPYRGHAHGEMEDAQERELTRFEQFKTLMELKAAREKSYLPRAPAPAPVILKEKPSEPAPEPAPEPEPVPPRQVSVSEPSQNNKRWDIGEPCPESTLREVVQLRQQLAGMAELSGNEVETAKLIEKWLVDCRPDALHTKLGGHGIAALYEGEDKGPTLLIRCVMDGLEVHTPTDERVVALKKEAVHCTGRDGTMAIVAGLASCLRLRRPDSGRVVLLFQSDSESGAGLERVMDDYRFMRSEPDFAFTFRCLSGYRTGVIVHLPVKATLAAKVYDFELVDKFDSHGPSTQITKGFMRLLGELLTWQATRYRESDGATATIEAAQLGSLDDLVGPSGATLRIRLSSQESEQALTRFANKVLRSAEKIGVNPDFNLNAYRHTRIRQVRNDPESQAEVFRAATKRALPVENASETLPVADDFGSLTQNYYGAMIGLGVGEKEPEVGYPDFQFPDEAIQNGFHLLSGLIQDRLQR